MNAREYDLRNSPRMHRLPSNRTSIVIAAALLCAASARLAAQETPSEPEDRSRHVQIALTAGPVRTTASGSFPSVLIGGATVGTGEIAEEFAETGRGLRIGLTTHFPISSHIAISLELASQREEIRYRIDSIPFPMKVELQLFDLFLGAQVLPYVQKGSLDDVALRSIYLQSGFDFGIGPLANRVEGYRLADSTVDSVEIAVGSFQGSDPFRTSVTLLTSVGLRFGLDRYLEVVGEAGYALPINRVFSSDVVPDNDLSLSHLIIRGGLAYRF